MFTPIGFFAPSAAGDTLYNYWNPDDYNTGTGVWPCSKTGATWTAHTNLPTKDGTYRGVNINNNSGASLKVFNCSTTQTGAEYINGDFDVTNQTWEMWTRQDVGLYTEWLGAVDNGSNDSYNLRAGFYEASGNYLVTRGKYGNNTITGDDNAESNVSGVTGTWFHIAITCGGTATDKKFYYNGVEMTGTLVSENFQFNGATLTNLGTIGVGWNRVNTYNYTSTLGPFRVYSEERTAQQVLDAFNAEKAEFGL